MHIIRVVSSRDKQNSSVLTPKEIQRIQAVTRTRQSPKTHLSGETVVADEQTATTGTARVWENLRTALQKKVATRACDGPVVVQWERMLPQTCYGEKNVVACAHNVYHVYVMCHLRDLPRDFPQRTPATHVVVPNYFSRETLRRRGLRRVTTIFPTVSRQVARVNRSEVLSELRETTRETGEQEGKGHRGSLTILLPLVATTNRLWNGVGELSRYRHTFHWLLATSAHGSTWHDSSPVAGASHLFAAKAQIRSEASRVPAALRKNVRRTVWRLRQAGHTVTYVAASDVAAWNRADVVITDQAPDVSLNRLHLQAMALRIPIVTTMCGDHPELVKHMHSGCLLSCERLQSDLSAYLRLLAKERQMLHQFGCNAFALYDTYYRDTHIAAQWLALYESLT